MHNTRIHSVQFYPSTHHGTHLHFSPIIASKWCVCVRRGGGGGDTNLPSLAVSYSYISVVVFPPHVHVVTERSNQLKWRSLMVIEWVVSNWKRRRRREQVTYYTYRHNKIAQPVAVENIKYSAGAEYCLPIPVMFNSTPLPSSYIIIIISFTWYAGNG